MSTLSRWHRFASLPITLVFVAGMVLALHPSPARAATMVVTTTADELNSDGDCSLREALEAANSDTAVDSCPAGSGADRILLPAGTYTIVQAGTGTTSGDFDITDDLTLVGASPVNTIIDANGLDRGLAIYSSSIVSISNLTVRNGNSGVAAGSGIWVRDSTLTLTRVQVMDSGPVGGIYLVGSSSLTLESSRVKDNQGSGVTLQSTSTATILNSTISDNTGARNGGGIQVNGGTLTVVNSTISGNQVEDYGGGINGAGGTTSLYNVTITGNTADSNGTVGEGGGVYMFGAGTLRARNSIIAGNSDNSATSPKPDCAGALDSGGYNLIADTTGCTRTGSTLFDLTGVNPLLGPLQGNGGPTFTHELLAGSPAVDGGNPNGCADQNNLDLTLDQRGFLRTSRCDIGAYEFGSPGAPTATPTALATNTATPTDTPRPTRTPTRTSTATSTATSTSTPTATRSATSTGTPVNAQTATARASITPTLTPTPGEAPVVDLVFLPLLTK